MTPPSSTEALTKDSAHGFVPSEPTFVRHIAQHTVEVRGTTRLIGANLVLKRLFDIGLTLPLLVVFAPFMLIVAALIKLSSRGPVFHVQQRVGYRGRKFTFFKFRSMHVNNDDQIHREYVKRWIKEGAACAVEAEGKKLHKLVNDPRVFAFGRFIRKYSIDELPQLLNVLRGDMSLIGPRPALPYEVDVYADWHRRRFDAPPGITGLWQVSGRNRLTFDEMVKLDIQYLENWTLGGDLRILLRTARVVLLDPAC
jgi:lipopolysaccharide/colanic/teichoic acid biosynthesis glycosyltransferase